MEVMIQWNALPITTICASGSMAMYDQKLIICSVDLAPAKHEGKKSKVRDNARFRGIIIEASTFVKLSSKVQRML